MEANVYNVIWADDDIDSFRMDDVTIRIMKSEKVRLLDFAHTSTELREKLNEWEDMVDAVITDGNFDRKRTTDILKSTSGLSDVLSFINEYNRKRFIPFFLYTGKKALLKDKFTDGELEYFENRERIFEKGNFKTMLLRIKEDVDHINSPEFRIHNKYAREFEAAKLIEEATENLQRGLLYLYEDNSWKNVQDYFNPARKIVERIMTKCKEKNLLPQEISLNNASRMFSGLDCGYSFKKEIMPKPLAESLFYFLKITQDGSHDDFDMSLGVDKYVRETQNINLYRTILYIAMDLLLWYKGISDYNWEEEEQVWEGIYIFTGEVSQLQGKFTLYTGKYELQSKDTELKAGDIVGIIKSEPSRFPKGMLTEFVKKGNYKIIS